MAEPTSGMFERRSSYLDRWVRIGVASGKVINVAFPASADATGDAGADHPILGRIVAYLDAGEPDAFEDVEIGLTVSTEARRVYETVRTIPYGHTWSAEEVVERTATLTPADDGLAIVRETLGENPVPVIVPDHRVRDITGAVAPGVRAALQEREGIAG